MTGAPRQDSAGDAHAWRVALLITAAAAALRLALAAWLPLFPDETYYWHWSRHLAGGYFDHPPLIAVLIRAGTALAGLAGAGHTALAVRLFPVLAGALASLATTGIARRLGGGEAACRAAIILAVMPLVATGLVLATPDSPLLAASACGLYAVVRALQAPLRSRTALAWWSAAGVALGLAFASKYTSILLPVSIVAAVLARPGLRARLREPGPYLACVIATLVFLPVLRWNAAHDWISFRFQLQHGLGSAARGSAMARELSLVGGQLGLVSPIVFALLAYAVWRAFRAPLDDVRMALAIVAVASWCFFVYSALHKSVEANWPAPSYVPATALLASLAPSSARDAWLRRGVVLAGVLVGIVYVHAVVPVLPIPARKDPVARAAGWSGLAAAVARERAGLVPARSWIGADRYQDVSELAYHAPAENDAAFCMCFGGRANQYTLWPGFDARARPGDALVLALDETADMHGTAAALVPWFATVRRGALVPLMRGADTVSVRRLWVLQGWRGGWPARAVQ